MLRDEGHTQKYTALHIYTKHTLTHLHPQTRTHTHAHTHARVHTHKHTRTHTHKFTHTNIRSSKVETSGPSVHVNSSHL